MLCNQCSAEFFLSTDGCTTRAEFYPIEHCETYALSSNNCEICEQNFFLEGQTCVEKFGQKVTPAPKSGHILNCAWYEKCNNEVYLDGLDSHISSVLSCHKCREPAEIPFAFVRGGLPYSGIEGLNRYNNNLDPTDLTVTVYD